MYLLRGTVKIQNTTSTVGCWLPLFERRKPYRSKEPGTNTTYTHRTRLFLHQNQNHGTINLPPPSCTHRSPTQPAQARVRYTERPILSYVIITGRMVMKPVNAENKTPRPDETNSKQRTEQTNTSRLMPPMTPSSTLCSNSRSVPLWAINQSVDRKPQPLQNHAGERTRTINSSSCCDEENLHRYSKSNLTPMHHHDILRDKSFSPGTHAPTCCGTKLPRTYNILFLYVRPHGVLRDTSIFVPTEYVRRQHQLLIERNPNSTTTKLPGPTAKYKQ